MLGIVQNLKLLSPLVEPVPPTYSSSRTVLFFHRPEKKNQTLNRIVVAVARGTASPTPRNPRPATSLRRYAIGIRITIADMTLLNKEKVV